MNITPPHNLNYLTHPKYRADIDGLRAIAVLSVVGFHAFPSWVKGGFIGVDMFFVISGFLISTIIFGSLDRNNFSFIEFYSRRIKRIFPALILVLLSSYVFAWFQLLADEYMQLGKHIAGGAGFVSNFILWQESGYFDSAAESKPMLHLWSLGIEEQFYIVWPVLIFLVPRRYIMTMTFVSVLLACLFIVLNFNHPNKDYNYFHTLSCAVALLTGSLMACLKQFDYQRLLRWISVSRLLSPVAILLFISISILYRLGKVEDNELILIRLFICVLGFYWVGKAATKSFKGWFGLFLSNKWVRKIGQMAYGIYIFHYLVYNLVQPILVKITDRIFQPVIFEQSPLKYLKYNASIIHFPFLVAAVIALAWISFTFFESKILKLKNHFE